VEFIEQCKEEPEIYIVFNIPKVSKTHKINRKLS